MTTDIEEFIAKQKAKIAREKEVLETDKTVRGDAKPRKHWDKSREASALPQPAMDIRPPVTPDGGGRLKIGRESVDLKRQKLREERQREYNEMLNQQLKPKRMGYPASDESKQGVLLSGVSKYDQRRQQLNEERRREYNELLEKRSNPTRTRNNPPTSKPEPSRKPIQYDAPTSSHANREVPNDQSSQLHQQQTRQKENLPPRGFSPEEEVGLITRLGGYEERRKRLNDERKREYNQLLAQKNVRSKGTVNGAENYASTLPGMRDVVKNQPSQRRSPDKRERSPNPPTPASRKSTSKPTPYEESPRAKSRRRPRPEDEQYEATLPGLNNHPSAEFEKVRARNQEYNAWRKSQAERSKRRVEFSEDDDEDELYGRFLRDTGPRRGWATPTYEEILDKKRRDERAYRKYEDPQYMRASRSDGYLNRQLEDDLRKFRELDREFESKKVRFTNNQNHSNNRIFNDPNWLDGGGSRRPHIDDLDDIDYSQDLQQDDRRLDRVNYELAEPRRGGGVPQQGRRGNNQPSGYQATLNVGRDVTASADQRKKAAYRQDLERQMQQTRQNKRREKEEGLRVEATGENPVFGNPSHSKPPVAPRQPSRLLDDNFSPRTILFSDDISKRGMKEPGILEKGFDSLYPSSVINKNSPRLDVYGAGDDAYSYYGKVDPLSADGDSHRNQSPPSSRVRFAPDNRSQGRPPQAPPRGGTNPFPSDDDRSKSRQDAKNNYKEELLRQIEEDKRKKQKEKEEKEKYDRKIEEEIKLYDPFGKGGGGAPMRDTDGNVLADLRIMKNTNDDTLLSGRRPKEVTPRQEVINEYSPRGPVAVTGGSDEPNHQRGGNGIFGDGLTTGQKNSRTKYQEDLAKQIAEKKKQQEIEKQKIKEEEEKLLKKIEEDNRRIQEEYEADRRKEREKAEAAQRQAEELKRQQEEKQKEIERKRKEADEARQAELRRQEDERRRERERQTDERRNSTFRSDSPPIPTMRKKQAQERRTSSPPVPALRAKTDNDQPRPGPSSRSSHRDKSPPVPATRTQSRQSRAPSADVLNQLARMKAQLQSESKRVEQDLKKQEHEPEVYDSRLYQKPVTPAYRNNVDVFEIARHKDPAPVRRPSEDRNDNIKEFQKLKKGNTESRNDLRSMFPNTPTSNDALETQQRALLDIQSGSDRRKTPKSPFDQMPSMDPKALGLFREKSTASANLLESDSAFIGVPENDGFPDDFDNLPRYQKSRNDSARSRRRGAPSSQSSLSTLDESFSVTSNYIPSAMGSQISLDPESINRRNEDRLKKLKSFGDEVSVADPDDILERFMAKQQHYSRPPSGHTLQDDSWLRPGTRYDR